MLNAVIIDDEPKAIELMENYCNRCDDIGSWTSFRNPINALKHIEDKVPHIIFLDINMPNISGVQLAKLVPKQCRIIFTTAYPQYAVESYDLDAADYLLKPVVFQRFLKAVTKVSKILKNNSNTIAERDQTLLIKSGYQKHRVNIDDILYLKKDGNYMVYYTNEKKIMARETIADALDKLPHSFVRTHKSYIVSIEKIDLIESKYVFIKGTKIPISDSHRTDLEKQMR